MFYEHSRRWYHPENILPQEIGLFNFLYFPRWKLQIVVTSRDSRKSLLVTLYPGGRTSSVICFWRRDRNLSLGDLATILALLLPLYRGGRLYCRAYRVLGLQPRRLSKSSLSSSLGDEFCLPHVAGDCSSGKTNLFSSTAKVNKICNNTNNLYVSSLRQNTAHHVLSIRTGRCPWWSSVSPNVVVVVVFWSSFTVSSAPKEDCLKILQELYRLVALHAEVESPGRRRWKWFDFVSLSCFSVLY